jgi:hypothetical protein
MTCMKCGGRAAFISPIGTMCPTDALLAAAFHDWIPERIRSQDRIDETSARNALSRFIAGKAASHPFRTTPRTQTY